MRIRMFACVTLLGALLPTAGYTANPVSDKASNITPADTRTPIAPELPPPPVADNASPLDFLHAARDALAHGKTGQAQEALERAEARALDRCSGIGRREGDGDARVSADDRHVRRAGRHDELAVERPLQTGGQQVATLQRVFAARRPAVAAEHQWQRPAQRRCYRSEAGVFPQQPEADAALVRQGRRDRVCQHRQGCRGAYAAVHRAGSMPIPNTAYSFACVRGADNLDV